MKTTKIRNLNQENIIAQQQCQHVCIQNNTTFSRKGNYLILVKKSWPVPLFHKPFCIIMAQRNSVIQVPKPYDSAGVNISHIIRKFGTIDMKITQCN